MATSTAVPIVVLRNELPVFLYGDLGPWWTADTVAPLVAGITKTCAAWPRGESTETRPDPTTEGPCVKRDIRPTDEAARSPEFVCPFDNSKVFVVVITARMDTTDVTTVGVFYIMFFMFVSFAAFCGDSSS